MPLDADVRKAFCEIGQRCWQRGFIAANDGNFSYRLDSDRIICTPTMISKGFLKPEDMVIVDMEGNQIGGRRKGTSEIRIHINLYRQRPDIYSVVHVHPPHATAFAIVGKNLPKGILQEIEIFLGEVPLAPYATTGTWEFAKAIDPWAANHDAFLLSNHGAVTVGRDPYDAYYKMETLDQYCRILMLTMQLGKPRRIEHAQLLELLAMKKKMGIDDPRPLDDLFGEDAHAAQQPRTGNFVPFAGRITDEPKV